MELFSFQSLLLLFFFFFFFFCPLIYIIISIYNQNPSKKPTYRGLKTYPLIGNLPDFISNRHRFLDWSTEILAENPTNTFVVRRPGRGQGMVTANPSNVEHILKTNFDNYPKGDRFLSLLKDFLGGGIFNSDGESWRIQRKTASSEFNTKSIRTFVLDNVGLEIEKRLMPILYRAAENSGVIDLQDVLERFAFDVVSNLALNEDPACLSDDDSSSDAVRAAFEDAANFSAGRFTYAVPFLWKLKKLFNIGSERRLRESISTIHEFTTKLIRLRKTEDNLLHGDLLSRFIGIGESSEEFLRDIAISFIVAGRDSTSSALAWFFWLLSSRPDVEQNILKEIKSVRTRHGNIAADTFTFEELRDMQYLHAAISETLRLYPPVPVDSKACMNDDVLPDGTFVGKGGIVSYHSFAMGRMERVWGRNCREFSPERWLENGTFRQANPFRYPVFQAGPRTCLGKEMAYIQMKFIAACVIEKFKIEMWEKNTCPQHVLSLTLRMKGGLPVGVVRRSVEISVDE